MRFGANSTVTGPISSVISVPEISGETNGARADGTGACWGPSGVLAAAKPASLRKSRLCMREPCTNSPTHSNARAVSSQVRIPDQGWYPPAARATLQDTERPFTMKLARPLVGIALLFAVSVGLFWLHERVRPGVKLPAGFPVP